MKYARRSKLFHYDYTLTERYDEWIPVTEDFKSPPQSFENRWGGFETAFKGDVLCVHFWLQKGYAFDGATGVRDVKGCVEAAGLHDFLYQFAKDITWTMKWVVSEHLDWANMVFKLVMAKYKCRRTWLYYTGVKWFGDTFWRIAHWKEW